MRRNKSYVPLDFYPQFVLEGRVSLTWKGHASGKSLFHPQKMVTMHIKVTSKKIYVLKNHFIFFKVLCEPNLMHVKRSCTLTFSLVKTSLVTLRLQAWWWCLGTYLYVVYALLFLLYIRLINKYNIHLESHEFSQIMREL